MIALSAARRLLQSAVGDGVCSAAALGVVRSQGQAQLLAVGRTSSQRQLHRPGGSHWIAQPGTPIDVDTPFDLASLTKPMVTSTLLALAVQSGAMSLADRVDRWLHDAGHTPVAGLTLGQLAAHAAGLPAWIDFFAATADIAEPLARAAAVRRLVLHTPLQREPASASVYSDLGFLILGWCLQAAAGKGLEAQFSEQIAAPLGLSACFRPLLGARPSRPVVATEVWSPRCPDGLPLCGEVHDDNCAALGGVAGHAGLFGSVRDVSAWAQAWLQAARGCPNALGLHRAIAAGWPRTAGAPNSTWRLAFDTPTQPGSSAGSLAPQDAFGHLGFTGTSVWIAPSADVAVVLLTNRVHPSREASAGIRALRPAAYDAVWSATAHADAPGRVQH